MKKKIIAICILCVLLVGVCILPASAAGMESLDSGVAVAAETDEPESPKNVWDYITDFFGSFDLSSVMDFFTEAWDFVTSGFGFVDIVRPGTTYGGRGGGEGPISWLDGR